MQLKYYLKEKNIKISDIARNCNIPYTTVNEIINGKIDIDRVQIGTGLKIAKACDLSFEEFYKACKASNTVPCIKNGKIIRKNKAYYLQYSLSDENGEIYLCKINKTNTHFVKDMAEWTINTMLLNKKQQKSANEVEAWEIDSI